MLPFQAVLMRYIVLSVLALLPHAQSLNLPTLLNETIPQPFTKSDWSFRHCVTNQTWNPGDLEIAPDCENALIEFADDVAVWGPNTGTFTYNDGSPFARFPGVGKTLVLPKRYVSNRCVVAVAMMKLFQDKPEWKFPNVLTPPSSWPEEDQISWKDMVQNLAYVRSACPNGCGYTIAGRNAGIGLVTWGTNSKWDQFVMGMEWENDDEVDGSDTAKP